VRADDAYVRLLRRLLFGADARVPVEPREAPAWLRMRGVGDVAAQLVGLVNFARVDLRRMVRSLDIAFSAPRTSRERAPCFGSERCAGRLPETM
jgi:hypothetical protein